MDASLTLMPPPPSPHFLKVLSALHLEVCDIGPAGVAHLADALATNLALKNLVSFLRHR